MKYLFWIFPTVFFSVSGTLSANEVKGEYLIQVAVPAILRGNESLELSKLYCLELERLISDIEKREIKCECIYENEKIPDKYKSDFDNFIKIIKLGGRHHVNAEIINSSSTAEGLKFSWQTSDKFNDVKKLVARFINYRNEGYLLELEKAAESAFKGTCDGSENSEEVARENEKRYVRSILEIAGILGGGFATYQLFDFSGDRDFDTDWDGIKDKFSSRGFRFDDNHRRYNFYAHPLIGSIYYRIGRTNGLNKAESFLTAFVASALWEFIAELPEVSSINDQFQTAFAGAAIGEVSFQLSNFYRTGEGTVFNKILAEIFDPVASFHNWMDGKSIKRSENVDQSGWNNDLWHRINIYSTTLWLGFVEGSCSTIFDPAGVTSNIECRTLLRASSF